eukprot:8466049-Alexandrium_andersonii.AAC.1
MGRPGSRLDPVARRLRWRLRTSVTAATQLAKGAAPDKGMALAAMRLTQSSGGCEDEAASVASQGADSTWGTGTA